MPIALIDTPGATDDDGFVRVPFDQNGGVEAQRAAPFRLLGSVNHDGRRERQLVMHVGEHLFAHDLGDERPLGLIGHVVGRIERLPVGQVLQKHLLQTVHVFARQRRDRNDLLEADMTG